MTNDEFWEAVSQPKINAAAIAKDIKENNYEYMFWCRKSRLLLEKEGHTVTEALIMKNLKAIQKEVDEPPDYDYAFDYESNRERFYAIVI
jgi:hypothetical protein